jgi:hypothetical protein
MSIRNALDKLFGSGEYVSAKRTIKDLESKRKLTGKDKKDKREAEKIMDERRRFLQKALAVIATLGVGTYLGISNKEKFGCEPDKKSSNTSDPAVPENNHNQLPISSRTTENFPSGEKMRALLDRGFEKVFRGIPTDPNEGNSQSMRILSAIKAFRKQKVKWAELRGRKFYSLETGHKFDGWMVVLNPSNEQYHTKREPFVIDTSSPDGIIALLIKPCELTETWAGIFQAHELIHLHDLVLKLEPRKPNRKQYLNGEMKAYFVERVLADHITNGRYSKEVQAFIKRHNFKTFEDVQRYINTNKALAFRELDQIISNEPPKSHHELALRMGFHNIVVSMDVETKAVKERGEQPDLLEILAKVLNTYSGGVHVPRE